MDDLSLALHDAIAAKHYHHARDIATKMVAAIEQAMRRGEAEDQCYQAKQNGKCVHVFLTKEDVDARQDENEVWE